MSRAREDAALRYQRSSITTAAQRSFHPQHVLMLGMPVAQVRHAAEDQVNGARQEAQRAIRDLQTAASRLQVWHGSPFDFPHSCHTHKQPLSTESSVRGRSPAGKQKHETAVHSESLTGWHSTLWQQSMGIAETM